MRTGSRKREEQLAYRDKDFISRQIAILARLLTRVAGYRDAGRTEEARMEIERGAGAALGLEYTTLERLDVPSAVVLLRERELAVAYAQLLEAEAGLSPDDPARAGWLRERASAVRRTVASEPPDAPVRAN